MSYIIFDLEWNQPISNEVAFLRKAGRPLSGEIIQIGAVKVDEDFKVIDTFNIIVKPKILLSMHKHVSALTGITTEDIAMGIPFPKAYHHFIKWCGEKAIIFSWANDDIRILRENCKLHGIKTKGDYTWYDAQAIYSYLRDGNTQQISLDHALEREEINKDLHAHNALHDSMYTARIMEQLPIVEGMAIYDEKLRSQDSLLIYPDSIAFHVYDQFTDKKKILSKPRVRRAICPICSDTMELSDIEKVTNSKFLAPANCEKHGDYAFLWTIHKYKNNKDKTLFYCSKTIMPLTETVKQYYDKKAKINAEKREKHQQYLLEKYGRAKEEKVES